MTEQAARLLAEALRLSEEDRGELADRLLDSIEPVLDPAWEEEIGRRLDRSPDAARKLWGRAIVRLQHLMEVTRKTTR